MPDSSAPSLAPDEVGRRLAAIVGGRNLIPGPEIDEPFLTDIGRKYRSAPAWHVRPGSTQEVAAIVKVAAEARFPVTAIGGRTGTVGGSVAADGGILLSFERMATIHEIDPLSMTMTVDAGCILQVAQDRAEELGAFLPLDLGARGSATIGGVISTNAGGNRVVRWGMMRDMVLGLEAVLADGSVVSSLTKALKDNAGYNWKHLLIGAEGTLGIVTRAVLRLRATPVSSQTALVAASSFEGAIRLMRRLEAGLSGRLSSFELMWDDFYGPMTEATLNVRPRPLPVGHPYYALVEAMGDDPEADGEQFVRALTTALEEGLAADAVIAGSERERQALWAIREDLSPGFTPMRPFFSYDVSMGIADMPAFVDRARANLAAAFPAALQTRFYGHAGDGNLHAVISVGEGDDETQRQIDEAIFEATLMVRGSIAAEHGIGITRAPYLGWTRSDEEIALMQTLKSALDPHNIMNPGKLLRPGARPRPHAN
jgi:FAD/FMN-containing dehydrogenase